MFATISSRFALVVAALVLGAAGARAPEAVTDRPGSETDPRDLIAKVKVTAAEALAIAQKGGEGKVIEIELEAEKTKTGLSIRWTVDLVTEKAMREVEIDAMTGAVLEDEEENDPRERRAYQAVLRHAELDLGALIAKAETFVKGQVVAAELEDDDEGPVCEVTFANGRCLIEAEVEVRAGHLVGLELAGDHEDDEEHHDRADRDEDHHRGHADREHDDDDDDHADGGHEDDDEHGDHDDDDQDEKD